MPAFKQAPLPWSKDSHQLDARNHAIFIGGDKTIDGGSSSSLGLNSDEGMANNVDWNEWLRDGWCFRDPNDDAIEFPSIYQDDISLGQGFIIPISLGDGESFPAAQIRAYLPTVPQTMLIRTMRKSTLRTSAGP